VRAVRMLGMSYRDSCTPVMTCQQGSGCPACAFGTPLGCGCGTGLGLFLRISDSSSLCLSGSMGANKNTVQVLAYTVSLEDGTENTPRRNKQTCQKGEKRVYLSQRCGFDPLCRWMCHLRRYRGAPTPLYCRYFCFSVYIIPPNKCSVNCDMKKYANILVKTEKFITF